MSLFTPSLSKLRVSIALEDDDGFPMTPGGEARTGKPTLVVTRLHYPGGHIAVIDTVRARYALGDNHHLVGAALIAGGRIEVQVGALEPTRGGELPSGLPSYVCRSLAQRVRRWVTASYAVATETDPRDRLPWAHTRGQGLRYGLTRGALRSLGLLVSTLLRCEAGHNHTGLNRGLLRLVPLFNIWGASSELHAALPYGVRSRITHCDCGHYETNDRSQVGASTTVCASCVGGTYVFCEDDGDYHPRAEAVYYETVDEWVTQATHEERLRDAGRLPPRRSSASRAYIYSNGAFSTNHLNDPEIESTATGDFTLGLEFECVPNGSDEREGLVEHIGSNFGGRIICKEDGSLDAYGVELVFAPLTLKTLKKTWSAVEFPSGVKAWDTECCGTHVHIDSRAFTRLSLAKFVAFWNAPSNATLIRRIAGRHPLGDKACDQQAKQYASTVEPDPDAASIVQQLKNGELNAERYRAVNLTTLSNQEQRRLGLEETDSSYHVYNTVELRIFRASMRRERTLAQVEMAHASVMFAREGSARNMTSTAFTAWLKGRAGAYPNLASMLGLRPALRDKPKGTCAPRRRKRAHAEAPAAEPEPATPPALSPQGAWPVPLPEIRLRTDGFVEADEVIREASRSLIDGWARSEWGGTTTVTARSIDGRSATCAIPA